MELGRRPSALVLESIVDTRISREYVRDSGDSTESERGNRTRGATSMNGNEPLCSYAQHGKATDIDASCTKAWQDTRAVLI